MTPDLDHFLGAHKLQALRASHPTRRATDRDPFVLAATEAARRTLADVVDDRFTWPELVALELMRREALIRRRTLR